MLDVAQHQYVVLYYLFILMSWLPFRETLQLANYFSELQLLYEITNAATRSESVKFQCYIIMGGATAGDGGDRSPAIES